MDATYTSTGDDEIKSRSIIDVSTGPHDLNFFTDDTATNWRINHPLTLVTDPDTMAEQISHGLQLPSHKNSFTPTVVLNVLYAPVNGFWNQTNSSYGESASGLQAAGVFFGAKGGQVLGKA